MNYNWRTFSNHVLIKLDPENDRIKLKNGCELYIPQTEKDITVTGTIVGLPSHLKYPAENLQWKTDIEVKMGDEVIVYYLSVFKALLPETQTYFMKDGERFICIPYSSIYAKIIDGHPCPVNGYCLIEPIEDPVNRTISDRLQKVGLFSFQEKKKSTTGVVWGKVAYLSTPIKEYIGGDSDEEIDIEIGETVVMKRVTDILLQYELHSKVDEKKPYYRVQRRYVYAKI